MQWGEKFNNSLTKIKPKEQKKKNSSFYDDYQAKMK